AAAVTSRMGVRAKVPVVLFGAESIPGDRGFRARRRRKRALDRASGLLGANRIALSLMMADHPGLLNEVLPQTGVPVPVPIERPDEPGLTIGYTGRLVPERGLDLLLRACTRLYGSWTMLVAGSGPAQESMEKLAEQLGLSSRISWLGALPAGEMAAVWPRLDCLVYPARATPEWVEVTGRLLLQAMGRGIPVVATATGALPDVVGDSGILVPPEDVESLTGALQDLQQHAGRREHFGDAGRRRVLAEFVDAAVGRRTLSFWHRILSRTPVP
ncbi:MAG: glycosyltransferase, partial [Gemmatimonadales bacterium]